MPPLSPRAALVRELADTLAHAAALTARIAALDATPETSAPAEMRMVLLKIAARELGLHPDTVWAHATRMGAAGNAAGSKSRRVVDLAALLAARGEPAPG